MARSLLGQAVVRVATDRLVDRRCVILGIRTLPPASPAPSQPTVVYLAPDWPWRDTNGGRVRSINLIAALESLASVTVVAVDQPDDRFAEWSSSVRRMARPRGFAHRLVDLVAASLLGRGIYLHRAANACLPAAFESVLSAIGPSIVILGAPYTGSFIDAARRAGCRVIVDAGESQARSLRSIAGSPLLPARRRLRAALDARVLGRLERRDYPRADEVWIASSIDAELIAELCGSERVRVVPNASPVRPVGDAPGREVTAVAYVGSFGHPPNVGAAIELMRDIMPAVRLAGGPRKLILIGRDPTPAILATAASDAEVVVTGAVDDVAAPLTDAGLLAVPLRTGAGTRIKILEAAALGVPIVSTRFGAEGLDLHDGEEIIYAETPREFASAIVRIARDDHLRERLVRGAVTAVRSRLGQPAVDAAVRSALEIGSPRS